MLHVRQLGRCIAAAVCCYALGAAGQAQGYKVNLPMPPDAGFGGGDVLQFEVSPDGTQLAYLADEETADEGELFAVPTDGSRASQKLSPALNSRGTIVFFTFTPDSTRVVFIADAEVDEQFELYSAPVDGSAPAVRLHGPMATDGDVGDTYFTQPLVISTAPPRVVFLADLEENDQVQLYSAPVDGSTPPIVLNGALGPDQDVGGWFLLLTPDGSRVLYFSDEAADGPKELWSVPVDGSAAPSRVVAAYPVGQGIGGEGGPVLRLTSDGTEIVFRADPRRAGVFELFRVPTDGSAAPVPVLSSLPNVSDVFEFALTPDGSRVIYRADLQVDTVYHLWSAPTHGGAPAVRLSGPMAFNGDVDGMESLDGPFQISPDGARVVYRADQLANDRYELFSAPVDGSSPAVRLTRIVTHGSTTDYRITPDGQRVVYLAKESTYAPEELFVVFIGGGAPQRISGQLVQGGNVVRDFCVGTNRVAFRADARVDEQFELFSSPLSGFPPRALDLNGSASTSARILLSSPLDPKSDVDTKMLLSGDGTQVLYIADQATPFVKEVFLSPLDASEDPLVLNGHLTVGPPVGDVYSFAFAGRQMVYSAGQDLPQVGELFAVSLDDPAQRLKLHDHAVSGGSVKYPAVTPDGSRLVYVADPHELQEYELFSAPADGSVPPVELSGTIVPGGDVNEGGFVFSPDSSRVVYLGDLDVNDVIELYSAPVDGSSPQVELNAPLSGLRDVEPDVHVSPDGAWVVYRADQDLDDRIELYSVPIDGSAPPVKLNGALVAGGDVSSSVLITPDSSHVIYAADQAIDDAYEVFVAPMGVASLPLRLNPLLGADRDASPLAVTPDGQTVLYATDHVVNDSYDLYATSIDGSELPVRISQAFQRSYGVSSAFVTPDGARAVYVARKDPNDYYGLFSVPVDGSQAPIEIGHLSQLRDERIERIEFAQDGTRVVYQVNLNSAGLYTAWIDGSQPAIKLDDFDWGAEMTVVANDEVVYRAKDLSSYTIELFRVPLLGTSPAQRLHDPLLPAREVTAFATNTTGTHVLYRADYEADELYELFLVSLE